MSKVSCWREVEVKTETKAWLPKQIAAVLFLMVGMTSAYIFLFSFWEQLSELPHMEQVVVAAAQESAKEITVQTLGFDVEVPPQHIVVYEEAATAYNIPWTLLAAHHRVETVFSTESTDVSTAGAEGPFQFMPCTFVGWDHPTCSGKGKGSIPIAEKTHVDVIARYGGYGVDGNKDGVANPFHFIDAAYSAANYLAASGAADGQYEKAIFTYNHSSRYVEDVLHYFHLYEQHRKKLEANAAQYK